MERLFSSLRRDLSRGRDLESVEEMTEASEQLCQRYTEQLHVERLHLRSPRQAHKALLVLKAAA